MNQDRMRLIAMVDQDLAEWRDTVTGGTASAGADRSVRYWLDRLPEAWLTDPRELVSRDLVNPLLHVGLLQFAKWTAEQSADAEV